jgi:hypothetical protein
VIKAKSQAVLNTHTEHDFQDAFKNVRNAGNSAYMWKETTSRVLVAIKSEVSFELDGNTSPRNYGCVWYW